MSKKKYIIICLCFLCSLELLISKEISSEKKTKVGVLEKLSETKEDFLEIAKSLEKIKKTITYKVFNLIPAYWFLLFLLFVFILGIIIKILWFFTHIDKYINNRH